MSRTPQRAKGFTLIELLIYIAIVTVAVTVMTNFMIDVSKSAARSKVAKQVQQNTRLVIDKMMREVQRSSSQQLLDSNRELKLTDTAGKVTGFYLDVASKRVYYYTGARPATPDPANALSTSDVAVDQLTFDQTSNSIGITLVVEPGHSVPGSGGQYTISSTFVSRQGVYQ